jgi:hypothetical protein
VRSGVATIVAVKIVVFWDLKPCIFVDTYQGFGRCGASIFDVEITMKMKAADVFETLFPLYQAKQRYVQEVSSL